MSASTSTANTGKGKGHIKFQEKIGSNGAYVEVTGIKDEDTHFTVKSMPFYRSLDNTEEWVTPHNSNWILPEGTGGKLEVPMDLFINPKYASKGFKEVEEQRLQELYVEFKKFERKAISEWTEAEQQVFTEYTKLKQDKLNQQMEEMYLQQQTGQTVIQRQKDKKGWLETILGDPFRDTWTAPDPNEKLIFGDNDEATNLPPVPTGDGDDDKFMRLLDAILSRSNRQEYRFANYPSFDGSQDPYEWLIKFENACAINQVRNGRKLEILNGCLEGPAQAWWRTNRHKIKRFGKLNDPTLNQRESFKYWFIKNFCGPARQYQWTRELRLLKQQPGETVDSYAGKLTNLYFRADPSKAYPAYDIMNQFIEGLRKEIRIEVKKANPTELEAAIRIAKNAEIAYSDGGPLGAYSLIQPETGIQKELEQIKVLLTKPETTQECNLCYGGNHRTEDCPQRSIHRLGLATMNNNPKNQLDNNNNRNTCYACGKPGHMKRNCPRVCQSCGRFGHRAAECRQRNNYQPKVIQRSQNAPWNQNRNFQNNRNNQNNRPFNNNNGNTNRQNQNQSNQPKRVYVAQTEEDLANHMAELTNAIKSLKA